VVITPESSNEFPWISIWRFVKPHANDCVEILKARWLRPAFAESSIVTCDSIKRTCGCSCLKCTWSMAWLTGGRGSNLPPCQTKCKNRAFTRAGLSGGAPGAIAQSHRWKAAPRDEIYLFQIKYSFERFRDSEAIQEYNPIFLCCV